MYNHANNSYICPICSFLQNRETSQTLIRATDVVYKDEFVTALINSFFVKNNPGHVIIIPNKHFENIYDLPEEYSIQIHQTAKKVAIALKKAYNCDGVTLLQNNEPAGGQHAFHYHLHIFPRYESDELNKNMLEKMSTTTEERMHYAQKLKEALG